MEQLKNTNTNTTSASNNTNTSATNILHYNKNNLLISKDARARDKAQGYKARDFFASIKIDDTASKDGANLATFIQSIILTNNEIKTASEYANDLTNDITTIYRTDKNGKQGLIVDLFTAKKCLASAIFDARHGKTKDHTSKGFSWYAVCKNYINALHQTKDKQDTTKFLKQLARQEKRKAKTSKQANKIQKAKN